MQGRLGQDQLWQRCKDGLIGKDGWGMTSCCRDARTAGTGPAVAEMQGRLGQDQLWQRCKDAARDARMAGAETQGRLGHDQLWQRHKDG